MSRSLEEELNKCLPFALDAGYDVLDYWELTFGDIKLILNGLKRKKEDAIESSYNNATMIAGFVGLMLSGKPFPKLESFLPTRSNAEAEEEARVKRMEAMMVAFTNGHNKQWEARQWKNKAR